MTLVRTCDACGATLSDQPNDWDWFRLGRGVGGSESGDDKEACSHACALVVLTEFQHMNEAEWREAESDL